MWSVALNKAVSFILLAYFALFIVPPISSLALNGPAQEKKTALSGIQKDVSKQAARFIYDIIAWQQLKRTKQSDFLSAVTHALFNDTDTGEVFQAKMQAQGPCMSRLAMDGPNLLSHRFRSSLIRFSKSGISPPAFQS